MKAKLTFLTVAVLGSPILAHAQPTIPDAACTHAPGWVIAAVNAVLVSLGLSPIC
jgi:hypothetical protein